MPVTEPIRVYVSPEEVRASAVLNNGALAPANDGFFSSPAVGPYVSTTDAAKWENAIRIPGWYDAKDPRLPAETVEEAVKAFENRNSDSNTTCGYHPSEAFGVVALTVGGSRSLPQSEIAELAVANDYYANDRAVKRDDDGTPDDGNDPDDTDSVSSPTTAEETLLAFDAAADQATGAPVGLGSARATTADATDAADTPDTISKQPRGFKKTVKGFVKAASAVLTHPLTQLGLRAAFSHAAPVVAGTTAFREATKVFGRVIEPMLSGQSLSRSALKIERQPE